jgi:hypothetical protein
MTALAPDEHAIAAGGARLDEVGAIDPRVAARNPLGRSRGDCDGR